MSLPRFIERPGLSLGSARRVSPATLGPIVLPFGKE
jgi:hypothetical protein